MTTITELIAMSGRLAVLDKYDALWTIFEWYQNCNFFQSTSMLNILQEYCEMRERNYADLMAVPRGLGKTTWSTGLMPLIVKVYLFNTNTGWRSWFQSPYCWYSYFIWLWLQSPTRFATYGSCKSHQLIERCGLYE